MNIDWTDKAAVIAYAKKMGKGLTVIKRPEQSNYNIIHTSREADLLRDATIVVRS